MTKKKDPSELISRGRKEVIHSNHDLRNHLVGVTKLNQLTAQARKIIEVENKKLATMKKSKKGIQNIYILRLLQSFGDISNDKVKRVLDSSSDFESTDYQTSRVKEVKSLLVSVSKQLTQMIKDNIPIKVEEQRGGDYLSGIERYDLEGLIQKNATKEQLYEFIAKITNRI